MNNKLQEDINYVDTIINGKNREHFNRVYTETNEPLDIVFDNLDLNKKKVYTVMSSSDYLYMSYLHNANEVDCFDINPITYRYYFLRKWLIDNDIISLYHTNIDEVLDIINNKVKVEDVNEMESLVFWKYALTKMKEKKFYKSELYNDFYNNLLWISSYNTFNDYYDDLTEQLKEKLNSNKINFSRKDISNPTLTIESHYDYIFLSNILDYHRFSKKDLLTIKKYLSSILNNNGKVICTHINCLLTDDEFKGIIKHEKSIFEDEFDYSFLTSDSYGDNFFYQYTKK